ncbi:DUF6132 family protein [Horticoccus sp. 23ND18S-11]|uniref:DUF6132 family protein n=1 Tax=Horticoccus sp. 23ND18S-11 TaxID=3391832 RepID=UPI0039C996AB
MKLSLASLVPIAVGATLGGLMGYFGQCSSGTCPLTSTWWRGALYGTTLGVLWALSAR